MDTWLGNDGSYKLLKVLNSLLKELRCKRVSSCNKSVIIQKGGITRPFGTCTCTFTLTVDGCKFEQCI